MQFVSLFSLFLRPRHVLWVGCYFDEVAFRGFLWIPRILTELRSEKFEWFGPSPIEPFNLGVRRSRGRGAWHPGGIAAQFREVVYLRGNDHAGPSGAQS